MNSAQDYTYGRNANYTPRNDSRQKESNGYGNGVSYSNGNGNGYDYHMQTNGEDFGFMPDGADGFFDEESGNNDFQPRRQRQQYDKFAKRTIILANLPEIATHEDITDAVRGGLLLDVYLRSNDRTASVSFLEESAAHEFYSYVKRYDLYIRGKRVSILPSGALAEANLAQVEIRWNDRQFILPGHVANKVGIGATRNLVIYNCSPKHTEEKIREDLEHIHNLIVIKVTFSGGNCYISTNSVHNAMFARTCMMSRA